MFARVGSNPAVVETHFLLKFSFTNSLDRIILFAFLSFYPSLVQVLVSWLWGSINRELDFHMGGLLVKPQRRVRTSICVTSRRLIYHHVVGNLMSNVVCRFGWEPKEYYSSGKDGLLSQCYPALIDRLEVIRTTTQYRHTIEFVGSKTCQLTRNSKQNQIGRYIRRRFWSKQIFGRSGVAGTQLLHN